MKCKRKTCYNQSDNKEDFDDEGYCMACREIIDEMQREAAN